MNLLNQAKLAEFIGESNFVEGKIESIHEESIHARTHGRLEIHAKTNQDASLGQEVFFTLRPERITFLNESGQLANTFNGVIEEVVYVGEISKYMIRVSETDVFILKQQNQAGVKKYKKGDRVTIGWNPEDMRLV